MNKKVVITTAALALIAAGVLYTQRTALRDAYQAWQRGPLPPAETYDQVLANENAPKTPTPTPTPTNQPAPTPKPKPTPVPEPAPSTMNLKVPFILQAPYQNWDAIHEDACEEASSGMLALYYQHQTAALSKDEMEAIIMKMVDYENKTLGYNSSTTAAQTAATIRGLYGINAVAKTITSIDDIKKQVAAGNPVILPAYGKALHNPNFKNGGPLYHMLLVKGYTATKIITNDPGTRNGPDYVYDPDVLWNAIHDWNDGDVPNGAKVMIVVQK